MGCMCGRFTLTATPEEVEAHFGIAEQLSFPPRYNIAPTQPILLVMAGPPRDPGSNLPDRQSLLVRWGFTPAWSKDPKAMPLLINARSETAAEKASFRAAMRHRRVLVPATGFYEWKRDGTRKSQPWFIRPTGGGIVAFGALMETWAEPGGSEIDTAAILTTTANATLAPIHDRMPVVIRPEDYSVWLDCRTREPRDVAHLLQPVEPGFFETIPVSDKINKVANTGPEVQAPATHEPPEAPKSRPKADDGQFDLF